MWRLRVWFNLLFAVSLAAPPSGPDESLRWDEVVLGQSHGCGRTHAGEVFCWGEAGSGQLGNGLGDGSATPRRVPGLDDVIALSAGDRHTCALTRGRAVLCWGDNSSGQVGGSTPAQGAPLEVAGLGPVLGVSAGADHSCAVTPEGTVACWGDNLYGQLGVDKLRRSPFPLPVQGVSRAFAVAAGYGHTCAAVRGDPAVDGAPDYVICWGASSSGQLGRGEQSEAPLPPGPVATPLTALRAVAAHGNEACALDAQGVICWGGKQAAPPTRRVPATGLVTLSLGDGFGCAMSGGGRVTCWGDDSLGQLGARVSVPVVRGAFGLTDATSVSAGTGEACATRAGHPAVCWGSFSADEVAAAKQEIVAPLAIPKAKVRQLPQGTDLTLSAEEVLVPTGARVRVVLQTVETQPCANAKLFAEVETKKKSVIVTLGDAFLPDGNCIASPSPASAVVDFEADATGRRDLLVRWREKEDMYQLFLSSSKIEVIPLQSTFSAWTGETALWRVRTGSMAISCTDWLDAPVCARRASAGMPTCRELGEEELIVGAPQLDEHAWASPFFGADPHSRKISPDFEWEAFEKLFRTSYEDGSGCMQLDVRTWTGDTWRNRP